MLILFDIDGTLLVTQRAGSQSMQDAARRLFHDDFTIDGVDISGRLDPLIWRDLARANGIEDPDAHHDRFREAYGRRLLERITDNPTVVALPGVADLLAVLRTMDEITLGVLTGNYPETGRLKIEHAGLDPDQFEVAAWGIDGEHRRELPPVAMRQYEQRNGAPIPPGRVIVIGDTPHDIDCARHNGCRSIGVATGGSTVGELRQCGADLVVSDLSDTDGLVAWAMDAARV